MIKADSKIIQNFNKQSKNASEISDKYLKQELLKDLLKSMKKHNNELR